MTHHTSLHSLLDTSNSSAFKTATDSCFPTLFNSVEQKKGERHGAGKVLWLRKIKTDLFLRLVTCFTFSSHIYLHYEEAQVLCSDLFMLNSTGNFLPRLVWYLRCLRSDICLRWLSCKQNKIYVTQFIYFVFFPDHPNAFLNFHIISICPAIPTTSFETYRWGINQNPV